MKPDEIQETLRTFAAEGKSMFVTSSFQTHSIPLLHIIANSGLGIPVYILNTGFLMPETLTFASEVSKQLEINLQHIFSNIPKSQQRDAHGNFYFTSNPDYCCHINKVEPTSRLLGKYHIWINGIRADQNANRRNMTTMQPTSEGALRFHPMLKWSGKDIYDYIRTYKLPKNPLDTEGYMSIGCEPCTRKGDPGREGRWRGMNKTECGLHTELIKSS